MNVLICNVGSTSLKYQLFRMPEELVAASGGAERVGTDAGRFYAKTQENGALVDEAAVFPTHREAIERMLLQLQQKSVAVDQQVPHIVVERLLEDKNAYYNNNSRTIRYCRSSWISDVRFEI